METERSSDSCHLDFSDAQMREERVVAPESLGMVASALQASDGGVVRGSADVTTDGGVEDGEELLFVNLGSHDVAHLVLEMKKSRLLFRSAL